MEKIRRLTPLVYLFLFLPVPTLCLSATSVPAEQNSTNNKLTIHFIDVGHGDATLITCPDGRSILVDAGSSSGFPGGKLRYYLLKQGGIAGKPLEALIITRPDANNYNLVSRALDKVPVKKLYLAGTEEQYSDAKFNSWLKNSAQKDKIFFGATDQKTTDIAYSEISCGDTQIRMLTASGAADQPAKEILLMIRYDDFAVILASGGASAMTESVPGSLSSDWPAADILKIGSSARFTPSTIDALANSIKPQAVIISAGSPNNSIWHASSLNSKTTYSTTNGNLVVTSDGDSFKISQDAFK